MSPVPCGVDLCVSFAAARSRFCAVHQTAKRAAGVMGGSTCSACRRVIVNGDWVTRESTVDEWRHAVCPPRRPHGPRKRSRAKPLIDAIDAEEAEPLDARAGAVHSGPCIEALRDEIDTDDPMKVTCSYCLERSARVKPLTYAQQRRADNAVAQKESSVDGRTEPV